MLTHVILGMRAGKSAPSRIQLRRLGRHPSLRRLSHVFCRGFSGEDPLFSPFQAARMHPAIGLYQFATILKKTTFLLFWGFWICIYKRLRGGCWNCFRSVVNFASCYRVLHLRNCGFSARIASCYTLWHC